jgi:hypothetical protein
MELSSRQAINYLSIEKHQGAVIFIAQNASSFHGNFTTQVEHRKDIA